MKKLINWIIYDCTTQASKKVDKLRDISKKTRNDPSPMPMVS